MPGRSAPLSSRIGRRSVANRAPQGEGGRAQHDHRALQQPHRRDPGRDFGPQRRLYQVRAASTSRRRSCSPCATAWRRARPARAAARPARHGAQGAGGPARGDLQGGLARRAHGDPLVRRLRRPARARRVPRPHLRPGPPDPDQRARPARRRRTRPPSSPISRAEQLRPSGSSASAIRSPPSRASSWGRATSCLGACG